MQHGLQKSMRRFGRQCRGQGHVFVTLVRATETPLLTLGQHVGSLALSAQRVVQNATRFSTRQHTRLATELPAAIAAPQLIEHQSRRLTHGHTLSACTIVNPYDRTIAPMCKGKSHCPTQCGRKPGMIAEPASGCIFAAHLPGGNPGENSAVLPLVDKVQHAITQVTRRPPLALHSLAGDRARNDTALREALHARGMLTGGIPHTVAPITSSPTQEEVGRILHDAGLHRQRTPYQVHSNSRSSP